VSTPRFLDLPAGVQATRVPAARGELAALTATASGERRAPVLLVPGFTGSKEDFLAVLAPLAAAGHPVTAVDQRGQFESPGDSDPASYDVKVLAQDLLAVARGLGEPVHLVGHSFGGLVARAVALAEPAALRTLTLLASGPAALPRPAASNLALIAQALPVMDLPSIWVAKRQIETQQGLSPAAPEIEEFLRRRFVANDPVALLRFAEQLLAEEDQVDDLAAVGLPVLVLFGADDDAWPAGLQAEMAARLGARTVSLPGCGHSPAAECPDATVQALIDFWAST
jgi:pimeloyl-ACP methyl ester carboxylesterase